MWHDNECCICFEQFDANNGRGAVTTVCGHTFCRRCLTEWNDRRHVCPTCKQPLVCIDTFEDTCKTSEYACMLCFDEFEHVGITLSQHTEGGRIKVLRLNKQDAAFNAGVRNGDVLKLINGMACKRLHEIMTVMEFARQNKLSIKCKFERRLKVRSVWFRSLWR